MSVLSLQPTQGCGQGLLGPALETGIDGQEQIVAGTRSPLSQEAHRLAGHVDLDDAGPGVAVQQALKGELHAVLADPLAPEVATGLPLPQGLLVDLPDVAQDVGRQLAQGILAQGVDVQLDPGEVPLDLRETGQGDLIQCLLDDHRLGRTLDHLPDQGLQSGRRNLQKADDLLQGPGRIRNLPGIQADGEARRVPGKNPPRAIQDQASRSRDGRFPDHVPTRLLQEFGAANDLEDGDPGQEDAQAQQDGTE